MTYNSLIDRHFVLSPHGVLMVLECLMYTSSILHGQFLNASHLLGTFQTMAPQYIVRMHHNRPQGGLERDDHKILVDTARWSGERCWLHGHNWA